MAGGRETKRERRREYTKQMREEEIQHVQRKQKRDRERTPIFLCLLTTGILFGGASGDGGLRGGDGATGGFFEALRFGDESAVRS